MFVAEMGTYGPGEIAAMCEWVTPEVAVITALGPVHLERMGSLEKIAEAKAEILEKARARNRATWTTHFWSSSRKKPRKRERPFGGVRRTARSRT